MIRKRKETIEDDEPEPTDEEDNDTVTTVPLKRPTGSDLGLNNLTVAPIEDGPGGKLIFASCEKKLGSQVTTNRYDCNVPGATPGDNVVVSSTAIDLLRLGCVWIHSSEVSKHNVVSIRLHVGIYGAATTYAQELGCTGVDLADSVTFSIIVFRPTTGLNSIGKLEELPDLGLDK